MGANTLVARHILYRESTIPKEYPSFAPLYLIAAQDFGVQLGFFEYKGKYTDMPPKSGIYAIVCPDAETIHALQMGEVDMRKILMDNECLHHNEVHCYYNATYLGDINEKNAYQKLRRVEKAMKNVSAAKYAFQEFGCDLPKTVQQVTIDKFERYNNIRNAPDLRQEVRTEYADAYRRCVLQANELYNKETGMSGKKLIPVRKLEDHLVEKDYFEKNHIICVNEAVSDDFWKYLQGRMHEQPVFFLWKDKKPSLVLDDNSSAKGIKGKNIWKNQTGYREYNVMFPAGQSDIFYTWLLDYRTQDLKRTRPEIEMIAEGTIVPITMPDEDLHLWDAYCEANDLFYSINHGAFGENKGEQIRNPIIGVSEKDKPLADAILKRMGEDKVRDVVYTQTDIQRIDRMPRKCIDNPYLRQVLIPAGTGQAR